MKHALARGCLLNGYRIEKSLGGGGFSLVYLATDTNSNELVAIKEYLPGTLAHRLPGGRVEPLSDDVTVTFRQGIKRFFDEASALARLRHPNIVYVTDVFRANNTVYLVMRYEQGKDLRWYIKRHGGRLSEKFIRTVFPALLLGLKELHDHDLLHLDIKPANIFLRSGASPLLLDFGAAQAHAGGKAESHTLTAGFAPIEQHNRGEMGPWTDMYAIGASMLACMSGKAPPVATERLVKDKYRPAARTYGRWYSRQLLEAIDWCLQLDPAKRPQSAQELADFLNASAPADPEPHVFDTAFGYFTRLWLKRPWSRT